MLQIGLRYHDLIKNKVLMSNEILETKEEKKKKNLVFYGSNPCMLQKQDRTVGILQTK